MQDFVAFMSDSAVVNSSTLLPNIEEVLANIPFDSPALPDNYSARADVENRIIDLLVGKVPCKGSVVCAFGMLTYKLLQANYSRKSFKKIIYTMLSCTMLSYTKQSQL